MNYEILYKPSFSLLKVTLSGGESIVAEAGAMVSMSEEVSIKTSAKGGIFGSLKRSMLGGESFFMNTFTATTKGEVMFAPPLPGDIHPIELNGTIYAQSHAYIASTEGINIDTKWGGAKTFFSKEGLFLLKISGKGIVFLSSYGAIHEVELQPGQRYTVDTGHIVSFEEGVGYKVKTVGGIKSTLFSGEGLVCELTGPGKITIQTRNLSSLLALLPHKSS